MYICICKGITDSQITQAVQDGNMSYAEVREQLGVGTCCGRCAPEAKSLISEETAKLAAAISYAA